MVHKRLRRVFTEDEINRLTISEGDENRIRIVADVHGMKCNLARRFINNITDTVRVVFQLIIIHGYNHGTAIKDMLSQSFCNTHISEKHAGPYNQGITHMLIAA